jgi:hypothetical protein
MFDVLLTPRDDRWIKQNMMSARNAQGYLQHALLIPQMGSGLPRHISLGAQD